MSKVAIEGKITAIEGGRIRGWARDGKRPDMALALEIVYAGSVVGRTQTGADGAFDAPLPGIVSDRKKLSVRLQGTTKTLAIEASPEGEPISPPPQHHAYESGFDQVFNGFAEGWIYHPEHPVQRVEVDVLVDGVIVATGTAGHFREDLRDAGIGDGRHALRVPLPDACLDDKEHLFDIRVKGTALSLLHLPKRLILAMPEPELEGTLDYAVYPSVSGWAWDPRHPNDPLTIELYLDEQLITTTLAGDYREDLEAVGKGDGRKSFTVRLPELDPTQPSPLVRAKVAGTAFELYNSPLRLQRSTVTEELAAAVPAPIAQDPAPLERRDQSAVASTPAAYEGSFERAADGFVEGWAWDGNNPDRHVALDVFVDDQPAGTFLADRLRNDLAKAKKGSGDHGFRHALPDIFLDGREHTLAIREATTGFPLKHSPRPAVLEMPAPEYEGGLDSTVYPFVRGWAWNANRPGETVAVEIFLNDKLIITVPADAHRADLEAAGKGDGCKSFGVRLPIPMSPDDHYMVACKVAGSDFSLKKSPRKLEYVQSEPVFRRTVTGGQESQAVGETQPQGKQLGIDIALASGHLQALSQVKPPSIVIPVFNAFEEVRRCIDAVIENTTLPAKLILIDDASPDPRIVPLLKSYTHLPDVVLVRNEKNLGFTRTVNRGMAMADGDVILLNSDTQVTPRWLENMRSAAYKDPRIATVTALSDNIGAFSVPEAGTNTLPAWLGRDSLGRLLSGVSRFIYPQTPTGNGFCMYVKRAALDDLGLFDAESFPRGYGEENDFSMRALKKGWKHVIDDATFVFHERSASFGTEKIRLIRDSYAKIRAKHPEYDAFVGEFSGSARMLQVRKTIRQALSQAETAAAKTFPTAVGLPRICYVIHGGATGGTPQTNEDLMTAVSHQFETYLLDCDYETITLRRYQNGEYTLLEKWVLPRKISPLDFGRDDYDAVMQAVLVQYAFDLVHIRHLYKHTLGLPEVAARLNVPVVLSFHDFYYVCPTINLVDEKGKYCAGECTKGDGECPLPFNVPRFPKLKHQWVYAWRDKVRAMFPHVDAFVTTCEDAKQLYVKTFPELESHAFAVIEHGRDFERQDRSAAVPQKGGVLKILIPGQLTQHKGADFIAALRDLDRQAQRLQFEFLGNLPPRYQHLGHWHGTYKREEFQDRVKDIGCHVMGIFSIWAETYCHTLSESWACGVPVLGSGYGALGERIKKHGGGWIVDVNDPKKAYKQLLALIDDTADFKRKVEQSRLENLRTTRAMGRDYAVLYKGILRAHRHFLPAAPANKIIAGVPRVAYLAESAVGNRETVAGYQRILQWMHHPAVGRDIEAFPLEIKPFLNGISNEKPDIAMLQKGALSPAQVQPFLKRCATDGVKIVYDCLPDVSAAEGSVVSLAVQGRAEAESALLEKADLVIVPSEGAAELLKGRCRKIIVQTDALDERLWYRPLNAYRPTTTPSWTQASQINVLCLNLEGDAEDVAMLKPVFETLTRQYGLNVHLHALAGPGNGIESLFGEGWLQPLRVPPGLASYPRFVSWLRSESYRWTFAVAPLRDAAANRGKGRSTFLYTGALGLACLYSLLPDTDAVIADGVTGMLTPNVADAWIDKVLYAVNNCQEVQSVAAVASVQVQKEWIVGRRAGGFVAALSEALKDKKATKPTKEKRVK